jgi:hypothetical protein
MAQAATIRKRGGIPGKGRTEIGEPGATWKADFRGRDEEPPMGTIGQDDLPENRRIPTQPGGTYAAVRVSRWSKHRPSRGWRMVARVIAPNWSNRLWERIP